MIRVCLQPRCPQIAVYRGRCREHATEQERSINRAGFHIYRSKRWGVLRSSFLFNHPLCDVCGQIATDVHHRVDIAAGGAPYSFENLQALCHACHSKATRARNLCS